MQSVRMKEERQRNKSQLEKKKVIEGKNGEETKANDNEYFKEGRTALKQTLMLSDIGEERHAES